MMAVILLIFSMLFMPTSEDVAIGSSHDSASVRIHWSEHQEIQSPKRRWSIQICPNETGPADVYLKSSSSNRKQLLFRLNRDGIINWGKDDNWLFLEDQQYSNTYRLLLFRLSDMAESENEALQINKDIRSDVQCRLMPTENIIYYFPKFVGWDDKEAVISVGVITAKGEQGSFSQHCFGYKVSTDSLKIRSLQSEIELKNKYGASCQIWP